MAQRGVKPGQRHSGQFKAGHDPRRPTSGQISNGMTLAKLARTDTELAYNTLREQLDHKDPNIRRKAAEYILERGWGRAPASLEITFTSQNDNPKQWTNAELESVIAEAKGEILDGDYVEVDEPNEQDQQKQLVRV